MRQVREKKSLSYGGRPFCMFCIFHIIQQILPIKKYLKWGLPAEDIQKLAFASAGGTYCDLPATQIPRNCVAYNLIEF
jgi:hypothetical protein